MISRFIRWPDFRKSSDQRSAINEFASAFGKSKIAVVAFLMLLAVLGISLFAPIISPQNPYDLAQLDILDGGLPPGSTGSSGTIYWLGTDDQGRDMLSAIFYGLRTSLAVGVLSGLIALLIGTCLGLCVGYFGGLADSLIMRLADFQLGFPPILVALILLAVLGQGVEKIVIALIVVQWAYYARTVRATTQVEREKGYVESAKSLALGPGRIVFRHILPNCLPPLVVIGTIQVAYSIGLEATLSFLGLGLRVTEPSLGLLIANGFNYIASGKYWISFYPGLVLLVTIMSINLVGDHLRDVFNPRLNQ